MVHSALSRRLATILLMSTPRTARWSGKLRRSCERERRVLEGGGRLTRELEAGGSPAAASRLLSSRWPDPRHTPSETAVERRALRSGGAGWTGGSLARARAPSNRASAPIEAPRRSTRRQRAAASRRSCLASGASRAPVTRISRGAHGTRQQLATCQIAVAPILPAR